MTDRADLTISRDATIIDAFVDVDLELAGDNEGDFVETIIDVLRDKLAKRAMIGPGKYNLRAFCVLTSDED